MEDKRLSLTISFLSISLKEKDQEILRLIAGVSYLSGLKEILGDTRRLGDG
jgi:hypothetical protein